MIKALLTRRIKHVCEPLNQIAFPHELNELETTSRVVSALQINASSAGALRNPACRGRFSGRPDASALRRRV